MFTLKPLPYAIDALAPHISARTMALHHGKHHQTYVDNLNKLVEGTKFADADLEAIVMETNGDANQIAIFNNAGQVYNHNFFWQSLRPIAEKKEVPEILKQMIERDFGSFEKMAEEFSTIALSQFGSGWAWLVLDDNKLKIMKTANGEPVFVRGAVPLLALDVWEHSYYLDYENRRAEYVKTVFDNLLNWDFAARNASL